MNFLSGFNGDSAISIVNLSSIRQNALTVKNRACGARLCAVVKSDAYGHGMVEVARELSGIADCFAVASEEEGVKLRIAGIEKDILCLLPVSSVQRAHRYGLTVSTHSVKDVEKIINFCKSEGKRLNFHIAVNTGMNREGIDGLEELERILEICKSANHFPSGVFSHFYDGSSKGSCDKQFNAFMPYVEKIRSVRRDVCAHISASAGLLLDAKYNLDMVRIGLLIYGYKPINAHFPLKRAMKTLAPSLLERRVLSGQSLLYGKYVTQGAQDISVIAFGYENGFRCGGDSLFNNCCMNVSACKKQGKWVTVMSDADRFAKGAGTISYHVLTVLGNNTKRIYYHDGEYNEGNCRKV